MIVLLNGIEIEKEVICVNDGLNYGRFFDKKTKDYEIQLSSSEVIDLIEKDYNLVRNEIKIDDEKFNEKSDFTNTNYCSLTQLMKHPSDFEAVIKTYLDRKLLLKLFNGLPSNKFVINSTDSIRLFEEKVIIKGKAFELATNSNVYQK